MKFRNILVAVDFSPASQEVMRAAAEMAKEWDAKLTVAHVWQWPIVGVELPAAGQLIEDVRVASEKQLAMWTAEATKLAGRPVTSVLETGSPWDALVKVLERGSHDLAIVGTHGYSGLKHVLLGSVAEKVVRHAPCTVMVVRQ